jgi:hypothetical protein
MLNFSTLPDNARRALARSELRRRGLGTTKTDTALLAAMAALRKGVCRFGRFDEQIAELHGRIVVDCLTTVDKALLDSLPPCELSPVELVGLFAEIFETY